jgi:uncharacterized membrane protein YeaQ/YmgE (transglycosylase-associated protein family)
MLEFVIVLIVIGLIVGLIARLLVPGRDNIGILGTILLGIVGSFVGGFLWELVEFHHIETSHFQPWAFWARSSGPSSSCCSCASPGWSGEASAGATGSPGKP